VFVLRFGIRSVFPAYRLSLQPGLTPEGRGEARHTSRAMSQPEGSPTTTRAAIPRVLVLIKGLGPGGAERLVTLHARLRDENAYECHVAYLLAWKDAFVEELRSTGVSVTCLGARSSWDVRWVARLRALVRARQIDVVHAHSPLAAIGARLAARTIRARRRPRVVTTEHNVWDSHAPLTARMNRWTARLDDARLAVSEAVRTSMPDPLRRRTEVVLHGVDVEATRAAADRDGVRAELGIAPDEHMVVTVANLRATKGYPDLLDAARRVVAEHPSARFVAVGQGPMEAEIRARHAELALGRSFLILGYRPDAARIVSAADIFCLASHHEGVPLAMMEALVLGIPVVATDVGGVHELVEHGREALLVPPRDPGALAGALLSLLADDERRTAIAAAATARGDHLGVENAVRRTEAVYAAVRRR